MLKRVKTALLMLAVITMLISITSCRSGDEVAENDIVGLWEQFIVYPDELFSLGLFEVTFVDGEYAMRIYDDSDVPRERLVRSKGIFDISFDGTTWSFYSDWGRHGTGYFELKKVDNNTYEGYSYLNGKKRSQNRWVRK